MQEEEAMELSLRVVEWEVKEVEEEIFLSLSPVVEVHCTSGRGPFLVTGIDEVVVEKQLDSAYRFPSHDPID